MPEVADTHTQDIVVLGGTLGIFLATALRLQGKSVTVVERNALLGRDQEWNISRADMQVILTRNRSLYLLSGTSQGSMLHIMMHS